jgi:hypothetical protein
MITFEPVQLKDELCIALKELDFIDGDIEEIPFAVIFDEDSNKDYSKKITSQSSACIAIGQWDYPSISLEYFLYIYKQWKSSKINSSQSYAKSKNEVDFLLSININHYDSVQLLEALEMSKNPIVHTTSNGTEFWRSNITVDKKTYSISLFNGLCLYHFKVEESGNFDKYLPSYTPDDYFIRITCDADIDMNIADELANAFIFEIQATHNIILDFSIGRSDSGDIYYDSEELTNQNYNTFPLIHGKGINELVKIYNKAKTTSDIDYKILGFTKVIEYISPTIAKEKLYNDVQLKLASPQVLNPTSEYVDEIGEIFKRHQNDSSKDGELIRLAVSTVTDIGEVEDILPDFIKKGQKKEYTEDLLMENLMNKLILSIYDTRNQIAHAKANYIKKGNECPEEQKVKFSQLLDLVAVRCIRWFSMQPESKRAVSSNNSYPDSSH